MGEKMSDLGSKKEKQEKQIECGIVMPISPQDNCSMEHWAEVKEIIKESIESISDVKFNVKLVSDADDIGVIQKRIVQNIYTCDIIICDVSAKNPNVMFELGMRLAFDKPTVIIKDDKTDYSFDTGIIEHINYPRDLRFSKIIEFKKKLSEKVLGTYNIYKVSPDTSPFLKNFGKFQVAQISEDVIPADKLILEMLQDIQSDISRLKRNTVITNSKITKDAQMAIHNGIKKYIDITGITNPVEVIGKTEFYKMMEDICDAPSYFSSSVEFRRNIDNHIMTNY